MQSYSRETKATKTERYTIEPGDYSAANRNQTRTISTTSTTVPTGRVKNSTPSVTTDDGATAVYTHGSKLYRLSGLDLNLTRKNDF